jgi:single-strand DNA-binding protein
MASFNKVILIGNLVDNPELKQTPSGVPVTNFRIAVSRKFKRENEQDADFISIVAWRKAAEFVNRYFTKGKSILVCGQLQSHSWTDNDGNKRGTLEVVAEEVSFVERKTDEGSAQSSTSTTSTSYNATSEEFAEFVEMSEDSDLPF